MKKGRCSAFTGFSLNVIVCKIIEFIIQYEENISKNQNESMLLISAVLDINILNLRSLIFFSIVNRSKN